MGEPENKCPDCKKPIDPKSNFVIDEKDQIICETCHNGRERLRAHAPEMYQAIVSAHSWLKNNRSPRSDKHMAEIVLERVIHKCCGVW